MPRFDLIMFDLDGTLADSQGAVLHCMKTAFRSAGLPVPADADMVRCIGMPLADIFRSLHPEMVAPEEDVAVLIASYRACWFEKGNDLTVLFPEARETLEELHGMGIPLGVVSNKSQRGVDSAVSAFDLGGWFRFVQGAGGGRPVKPQAELYDLFIRPIFPEVAPARVLMVGDALPDIGFAKNIGANACWAAYGYGAPDRCRAAGAAFSIASLGELPGIVAG